ncbi:hypothetical protein V6N11_082177 [Hibiscus sabdariffa]|uniref:Uncharacterized protein n=1 Tax=Hibiscus sabdariffa TaxID=183260 RepID=A0ABR2QHA5_9ROSI
MLYIDDVWNIPQTIGQHHLLLLLNISNQNNERGRDDSNSEEGCPCKASTKSEPPGQWFRQCSQVVLNLRHGACESGFDGAVCDDEDKWGGEFLLKGEREMVESCHSQNLGSESKQQKRKYPLYFCEEGRSPLISLQVIRFKGKRGFLYVNDWDAKQQEMPHFLCYRQRNNYK